MGIAKHTYNKMNQDISRSKFSPEIFYEGKNIRIITNEAFGNVTGEQGNTLIMTLPPIENNPTSTKPHLDVLPYPLIDPTILGHTTINEDTYLLSKYDLFMPDAKFFYAQEESGQTVGEPYIDSNLRILIDGEVFFENYDSTGGSVEGPSLPTGSNVRIQGFHLATQPNQSAPDPTLYLDIYRNGIIVDRQEASLDYVNNVTLFYDLVTENNVVYFAHAYTLASPGIKPNPFTGIDIYDYIADGDIFAIHKMDKEYNVTLKFFDILHTESIKMDVLGFYENENIQKIYWLDTVNELRFVNVADPDLIELDKKFISTVPNVLLSQPEITGFTAGGNHTAGSIQYAYNLYRVNGAQTRISPLSTLAYLNNSDRGNDVNVNVAKSIRFSINDIDTSFDRIRVYSIKYNTQNSTPEIKIIIDQEVSPSIDFTDDNNSFVNTITFSEFIFLGGDVYIPQHFITKDNHLFLLNYKTRKYDVDFDARAYRYDSDGNTVLLDSEGNVEYTFSVNAIPEIGETADAINPSNKVDESHPDYNKYIWKVDEASDVLGGTGRNVRFEIKYNTVKSNFGSPTMTSIPSLATANKASTYTTLKSGETYRMFIEFLINDGKFSFPKWMADIRIPVTGSEGSKPFAFMDAPDSEAPVFRQVLLGNPPGVPTVGEGCTLISGIPKYIDYNWPVTHGLILYNDEALTERTYIDDPYEGNYTVLLDTAKNRKYVVSFDEDGAIDTINECGPIDSSIDTNITEPTELNFCYVETELLNLPLDTRISGWRTVIVERTDADKTVVSQGLYNSAINDNVNPSIDAIPSYLQRTIRNTDDIPLASSSIAKPVRLNAETTGERNLSQDNNGNNEILNETGSYTLSQNAGVLYTPETIVSKGLVMNSGKVRRLGLIRNTFSRSFREVFDSEGVLTDSIPEFFSDGDLSREVIHRGAILLMNMPISLSFGPETRALYETKIGKFISDNKAANGDIIFSKKRYSYVRYFGGLVYFPTDGFNHISVDNHIGYISPIQNIFNIDNNETVISIPGLPNVQVKFNNNISDPFRYFTGSAIVLTGPTVSTLTSLSEFPETDSNDYGILAELYRIVQNQYGGDDYNSRALNRTIPYSNIVPLAANQKTLEHTGDTFIQKFNFLKTFRSGDNVTQVAEIVSFPVETSTNLDLRFDLLKNRPDNYEADELTSYGFNSAYNQQNNTIRGVPKPFNFTEMTNFPVNVIPSRLKINGELIDSFTDFMVNDIKTLDGKYGEITGVAEFRDNVYSFQRNSVAYLAINPRVQIQASDGIPIELGSGKLIERYQYITTNSGTLNKWSIQKTKNGLMYFDLLNKSINFLGGESGETEVSTINGLYNKLKVFTKEFYDDLLVNNPVVDKGVIAHFDNNTEDIYFTFKTGDATENFTVAYNGLIQGFTSFYNFDPRHYISVNGKLLTGLKDTLWLHGDGEYGNFYGQYYPSSVTVICNDNPDINKIFDNLHFNSEFYDQATGLDLPNTTFNSIQMWNEYQNTQEFLLNASIYRGTIKRRLRKWNLIVPRNAGTRDRISSPWVFVKLEFDKNNLTLNPIPDIKFVLHDLLVSYTTK